jgi:CrcB protein
LKYLLVVLGGGCGALARFVTGTVIMNRFGSRFPFGTLAVNLAGSFLIGFLMTLLTERSLPHPNWRLLLVVGFLGGYTTFSSLEYESLTLVRDGGLLLGVVNLAGSVIFGFVAVWLGSALAGK